MPTLLTILYGAAGLGAVLSFVASFAAHILLQFYIDHDRVREETGEAGWKVFGSMLASADFYKVEAGWLWKVRRVGFAGFFICGGIAMLVVLASVVLDSPNK